LLTDDRIAGVSKRPKNSSFSMEGPIVSLRPKAIPKYINRILFQKVIEFKGS